MIAAARFPLRSDPANNQFERPSAHDRKRLRITPCFSIAV